LGASPPFKSNAQHNRRREAAQRMDALCQNQTSEAEGKPPLFEQ
jgi:hypothetical protein